VNVLITSASRKVSLVRAFQAALARRGGNVIAVDTNACSPALYVSDKHYLVSPSDSPGFIEDILQLCQRERVRLIVPTRDEELPLFAANRNTFEEAGLRVLVPSIETVRVCQDKLAFVEFCESHDFAVPVTYRCKESAQFPLFIKPRYGKASKEARILRDQKELSDAMKTKKDWLIQEYVREPEYTVDLLADFGSRVLSVVPRLRQVVLNGESYVSRTVNEPALIRESTRLAEELKLVGHNTIQCFFDGSRVKFIEVNPRFGGGAALGIAAGADTPDMLIRLLADEPVQPCIADYQADLVMLRYSEDLFLDARVLRPALANSAPVETTKRALRAVLFDLDNTLYPEEEFVTSGFRAVAKVLAENTEADRGMLLNRMLQILHAQGRGKIFNTLLADLNLDCDVWLGTLLLVYRSHKPSISLFPGARRALQSLKQQGVRLGVITDGPPATQRSKVSALGLERYTDAIVCTEEIGGQYRKPSPVPFEVALRLLGVKAIEAAYIADDASKDFAGPNRLGMKSVQINRPDLIGVPRKEVPNDAAFQAKMQAGSLIEALGQLGFDIS
jgi:carbamoyl-phosphate synthase large subunit